MDVKDKQQADIHRFMYIGIHPSIHPLYLSIVPIYIYIYVYIYPHIDIGMQPRIGWWDIGAQEALPFCDSPLNESIDPKIDGTGTVW